MSNLQGSLWLRAACGGALFACLGFSLALATSESRGLGGAGVRGISTNYTRPLAFFVTDSDLGAVVAGTQFTRQLIARFGFKPHHFTFGSQSLDGVNLSDGGLLTGAVAVDKSGPLTFDAFVADDIAGASVISDHRSFTLNAVPSKQEPNLALQFVNAPTLPTAVAHEAYSFTLHANGGKPPYTFQFADENDFLAFPPGLSLNVAEGLIQGKPVVPTPVGQPAVFKIVLTDFSGVSVKQAFSLVVLPGTISSEFVATSGGFALRFGKEGGRDSFSLAVVLNKTDLARAKVRQESDLTGLPFAIIFGGVTLPPALAPSSTGTGSGDTSLDNLFDKHGTIRFPNRIGGFMPQRGELLKYTIKLNPRNGVLTVKFDNIDLIKALGADFKVFGAPRGPDDTDPGPIVPVRVLIGAAATAALTTTTTTTTTTTPVTSTTTVSFDKTDVVKFIYRRQGAVGKGVTRPIGTLAPAGLFLVTKVQGKETQVDTNRDRLYLRVTGFLRQVGGKGIEFGPSDQVNLLFGTVDIGSFPASSLTRDSKGRLVFVNQDPTAGLFNFIIDNKKGTFFFDTHGFKDARGLDPHPLFGVDILEAGDPHVLTVTLTIAGPGSKDPLFDGQSSATLFRQGNSIRNK